MAASRVQILVVDDVRPERDAMCRALEAAGYATECVVSADEGRRYVGRYGPPDLLLLALRPQSRDAEVALCREIHAAADVPLIALTGEGFHHDTALMEACFDDFITAPADPAEIVSRVRRCLRRWASPRAESADSANNGQTADEQGVEIDGRTVYLTEREAGLLRLLMRYPDRALSREFLMQQVWANATVNDGALRVTVHRLRRKVAKVLGRPAQIVSLRGRGYMYATLPLPVKKHVAKHSVA